MLLTWGISTQHRPCHRAPRAPTPKGAAQGPPARATTSREGRMQPCLSRLGQAGSPVPPASPANPGLTMELRFRGDPEDCVKRPATDGRARRLGDTPELRLGVPADARFLLPRLRLSCPRLWPLSPRAPDGRGLCLLGGGGLVPPAAVPVKMTLLLTSLSGSEKPASGTRSPLLESRSRPWGAPPSRGLAQNWWAGEAEPELRGCTSSGGC